MEQVRNTTLNINKQNFQESNKFKKFCIKLSLHLHHEGRGKAWIFSFERMFVHVLRPHGNSFKKFPRKFQDSLGKLNPSCKPWRPRHFLWIFWKLFPACLSWNTHILSQMENSPFFPALIANLKGYSEMKFLKLFEYFLFIYAKGSVSYLFKFLKYPKWLRLFVFCLLVC